MKYLFYGTPLFRDEVFNKDLFEVYNEISGRGKVFNKDLFEVFNKDRFYGTALRLRDPASWLPLASRVSSRNLVFTFYLSIVHIK